MVVIVRFVASISEPASWMMRPEEPIAPVAEMVSAVRLTNPPDSATTTGELLPDVVTEPPLSIALPPAEAITPKALLFVV